MNSTDTLKLLAAKNGRYFLLERAVPRGSLKGDFVSIREADGREVAIGRDGAQFTPHIPPETLNDYLRASFIAEDVALTCQESAVFRITEDGTRRFSPAA